MGTQHMEVLVFEEIFRFCQKLPILDQKLSKNGLNQRKMVNFHFFMKNSANLYKITSKHKNSQIRSFYTVLDHFKVKYYQKSRIFDFPAVWASFLRLVTSHKKINKKLNLCSIIEIFTANRSKRLVLT